MPEYEAGSGLSNVVLALFIVMLALFIVMLALYNVVNNIVQNQSTPNYKLFHALQYCSILLTTSNNVDNKTLFNPVFINPGIG